MDHEFKSFELKPRWSYSAAGQQVFALVVGLVLHIVGYCSESWGVAKSYDPEKRLGVWEQCYCDRDTPDETWYYAFRGLITISGLFLIGGLLLGFIYMFCRSCTKSWLVGVIVAVLLASIVCGIIGYALFASDLSDELSVSWSYVVHLIGTVFVLFATISIIYQWHRISFI